jgi:hypothetical protein
MKANRDRGRKSGRNVIALLLLLAAVCAAATNGDAPASWRTYHSRDHGFAIAYPADFTFYSDPQKAPRSYMAVCAAESVACFQYSGQEYKGTNFGAAGLSVNILGSLHSEDDCRRIEGAAGSVQTVTINGVLFSYANTSEGAMSHLISGPVYRTFHDQTCYEITLLITSTNIGVYDPGAVKEFDSTKLAKQLDAILHTFRFVSGAKAGSQ